MRTDFENFDLIRRDMEEERDTPLTLYALLEREAEPYKWDLIISAPWIIDITIENMGYVIDKMKKRLTQEERASVAHIILLRPHESTVQAILDISRPVTQASEIITKDIYRSYLNGMMIHRGYVLATGTDIAAQTHSRH